MRIDGAGVGIALVELVGRMRSAAIDQIIEIDRQQRRPRADERVAAPGGIEFKISFGNYVLPAMVVEILDRCLAHLSQIPPRPTNRSGWLTPFGRLGLLNGRYAAAGPSTPRERMA